MRNVSAGMATLLTEYQFFVAELYTITFANGDVHRFTSGDGDIRVTAVIGTPYSILLHFDDDQNLDSSGKGNAVSSYSHGIYTTPPVFGTQLRNLGSGTVNDVQTSFPETAGFNFSTNDFTIRFRCLITNTAELKVHRLFSNGYGITIDWQVSVNKFIVSVSYNGSSNAIVAYSTGSFSYGFWRALSVEVFEHTLYMYVNGVLAITPVLLTDAVYFQLNRTMAIGGIGALSSWAFVDEFMIYNGTSLAQGASAYTVETAPYPDYSVAYYEFTAFAIDRSDITTTTGISVDDCTVTLHCNADNVFNDIPLPHFARVGGFDNAHLKIELAVMPTYGDTSNGVIHLFEGRVTDINPDMGSVALTVSADTIMLDTQIPQKVYQPSCTHTLYDSQCGLSEAAFTESATVLNSNPAGGEIWFNSSNGAGFFTLGRMMFTSGQNTGFSRTVKFHSNDAGVAVAIPNAPFPFPTPIGDSFKIIAGCDKLRGTCSSKFSNAGQFLGWEYMPVPEASV